jgi:PAS domain S-box-containing protein
MLSHLHVHHAADPSSDPGVVDALISQTRELRGQLDTVRLDPSAEEDPHRRWQRALCDLAAHHLDNLGEHLGQLREELVPGKSAWPTSMSSMSDTSSGVSTSDEPGEEMPSAPMGVPTPGQTDQWRAGGLPAEQGEPPLRAVVGDGRAGSAEWNLLTDEVTWSDELYHIFGRTHQDGPLTLDELPAWLFAEDQQALTAMVTSCLVDGRPIDGEFRIVRPDGSVRTVHMVGEPVLDADGGTASMWAVLRDVSELRRSQRTLRETRDSLQRQRHTAQTEHRLAAQLREAVLPPWHGPLRFPRGDGSAALELTARYFPSSAEGMIGGHWYDAMQLPDRSTLLTVGDLTGHGVAAASGMAMLLGALRGMAVAGMAPGPLMSALNQVFDQSVQPARGSSLCCRYEAQTRTLAWSQAGHPAPLLFRDGTGRPLTPPEGMLLGAASGAVYSQATEQLLPGDLLVLYTDGIVPGPTALADAVGADAVDAETAGSPGKDAPRLLSLGARFATCQSAQDCMRVIVEELSTPEREQDACLLIARVS